MTRAEATAEVFWLAFQGLPRNEKREVLERLARDQALREDLADLGVIEQRRDEPERPLREYLAEAST